MRDTHIESLLSELWRDLQQPDVLWQVGTLALCLVLAWAVARLVRRRQVAPEQYRSAALKFGHGGVRRIVFPVAALVLVLAARPVLGQWHHVNLLNLAVPLLLSLAAIRMVVYSLRQAFAPSGTLAAFERLFALTVWGVVALHIAGLLPDLIDWLEQVTFAIGKQKLNLWIVLQGVATVLVTLLAAMWLAGVIESRLMRAPALDSNLRVVFSRLAKALLSLLAILISLPLVGIDLTTLSVFGGALGVGLGFGLQKIASNYVSGFIILLDRSIRIGNMIAVDNHRGQVTQITTRYTVLRALTGVESIVPNEVLVSSVVQNESYTDPKVRIAIPVQVGYDSDVDRAMQIMVEAGERQSRVLQDPAPVAAVASFGDSGINLELGLWIADPQEGTLGIRSEINREILRRFREEGIEIPFPRHDVRLMGAAGPARSQ